MCTRARRTQLPGNNHLIRANWLVSRVARPYSAQGRYERLEGGVIDSCPAYGYGINQVFLDTINEYGLEQLITQPTRGSNTLDLIFCSQPDTISGIKIIPGISDHEAVFFHLDSINNYSIQKTSRHPILLYHKGNLDGLKTEMLEFQNQFMITNPYSFDVETNWQRFKLALNSAIKNNIPQVIPKSRKHLPWLNSTIRKKMQRRKRLYNEAKSTGSQEAWSNYRKTRNEITKEINEAHKVYQEKLFDCDTMQLWP